MTPIADQRHIARRRHRDCDLVTANLVLVPRFGLTGAATAALLAQGVWSRCMWLTALHMAKVDVSILPRLRELLHARRVAAAAKNG
jgi:O-antigen/teichoic acid export membrane protein